MKYMELIATCHFGMEAVLKREILDLGYEISKVEDGKVTFLADAEGIAQANMFLRTTERILLKTGEFKAVTFDELFEKTKAIPWEEYIPKDGKFWVAKANSVKSALFSPSDIQSIMKKAIVERLKSVYGISWFPEDGASFPVRVFLMKDEVTVGLDSTGESLHKRGYRKLTSKAPIEETLAAALIMLTPWRKDRIFVEKNGRISQWDRTFDQVEELEDLIQQIVSRINRAVNVAHPIADARLEDGSRVHVVLPPVALDGPVVTIRKFPDPITAEKLVAIGSLTEEAAQFLKNLVQAQRG